MITMNVLTAPQKKGVLYYYRSGLPRAEKLAALKTGPSLKHPDPRVTWKLMDLKLLDRAFDGRWVLTAAGSAIAVELVGRDGIDKLCARRAR